LSAEFDLRHWIEAQAGLAAWKSCYPFIKTDTRSYKLISISVDDAVELGGRRRAGDLESMPGEVPSAERVAVSLDRHLGADANVTVRRELAGHDACGAGVGGALWTGARRWRQSAGP
jgi:hypothetical protein